MLRAALLLVFSVYLFGCASVERADNVADPKSKIKSMQQRAEFVDDVFTQRVQTLLPELMREAGLDAWVLISREYNEDPILKTMLPATWLSARRTTIFLFVLTEENSVQAYAVAPYQVGSVFEKGWDKSKQPNQWHALVDLLRKHDPKTIGINKSEIWAHADGLVVTDFEQLKTALPNDLLTRLVPAEPVAIGWLERRIETEVKEYQSIVSIAHAIIAEGFSNKVIIPGKTTTDDVRWWYRERILELKLQAWFHPSVSIQRANNEKFDQEKTFSEKASPTVIQPGDLLHVDFGITYLRLNTDTQQHAYVLKEGESDAPQFLKVALAKGNQLQDVFTDLFAPGKTGNDILKQARQRAIDIGLKPTIYTHPIGYHGHGAGTTLGMWDAQGGVEGDGDYPLHLNTAYSIELNNAIYLKEWGKEIRIMLEEDAFFDESGVWYLNGRQTQFHLIQPK